MRREVPDAHGLVPPAGEQQVAPGVESNACHLGLVTFQGRRRLLGSAQIPDIDPPVVPPGGQKATLGMPGDTRQAVRRDQGGLHRAGFHAADLDERPLRIAHGQPATVRVIAEHVRPQPRRQALLFLARSQVKDADRAILLTHGDLATVRTEVKGVERGAPGDF